MERLNNEIPKSKNVIDGIVSPTLQTLNDEISNGLS